MILNVRLKKKSLQTNNFKCFHYSTFKYRYIFTMLCICIHFLIYNFSLQTLYVKKSIKFRELSAK